ncbi:hypothetical protein [Gilliamella sp. WF3-4]|uniref:hypothetical protein n=1 Tax=Gilliamella sp. WF3-4 TaxID=3120255 RepID=UPI00080EB8C1|nr:hypothetical protein [Gilliamella apicola]OCG17232.1 hypothetical protein A9G47_08930 [Gilliamella apicola]
MKNTLLEFLTKNNFYGGEKIYLAPTIPNKKLSNALSCYGQGLRPEEIYILIDNTLFGGAKDGVLITNNQMIFKEPFDSPIRINFSDIKKIYSEKSNIFINGSKLSSLSMPDAPDIYRLCLLLQLFIEQQDNKQEEPLDTSQLITFSDQNNQCINNKSNTDSMIEADCKIEQTTKYSLNQTDKTVTLKYIPSDEMYNLLCKIKLAGSISTIFFLDKKENPHTYICYEFVGIVISFVKKFRSKIIEKKQIKELENDIATIEMQAFACSLIIFNILYRGVNERLCQQIANESIRSLSGSNNNRYLQHFLSIIQTYDDADGEEEIVFNFIVRLTVTNLLEKSLSDLSQIKEYYTDIEIEKSIKTLISDFDPEFTSLLNQLANQISDLVSQIFNRFNYH